MKYRQFHDPGHSWLEVPRAELDALNLSNKVSAYSYQRDGRVYLEEDCDALLFIVEKDRREERIDIVGVYHEESPVREFDQYQEANHANTGR